MTAIILEIQKVKKIHISTRSKPDATIGYYLKQKL